MKLNDILDVDYRLYFGREIIQKALFKIPAIAKNCTEDTEVPLEVIEKVIGVMCRKYQIMIQYICPTYLEASDNIYCVSIKTTNTHEWLGNAYGCCLYEAMAKAAIKMYSEIKNKPIPLKEVRE